MTKYIFQEFCRKWERNTTSIFASLHKTASALQAQADVELVCCDEEQASVGSEVSSVVHRQCSLESISGECPSSLQLGAWSLCGNKSNNLRRKNKKRVWKKSIETKCRVLFVLEIRRNLRPAVSRAVRWELDTIRCGGWSGASCSHTKSVARSGNRTFLPFPSTKSKADIFQSRLLFSFLD